MCYSLIALFYVLSRVVLLSLVPVDVEAMSAFRAYC